LIICPFAVLGKRRASAPRSDPARGSAIFYGERPTSRKLRTTPERGELLPLPARRDFWPHCAPNPVAGASIENVKAKAS
jgi:hypothetical protein